MTSFNCVFGTPSYETVISLLLTMSENSVEKALIRHFKNREGTPSASAFVQQRKKLLPATIETLFQRLTSWLRPTGRFQGYRLLAADGSDLKSAAHPGDPASYRAGTARQHGWNLWHLNALYGLQNGICTNIVIQKEHEKNEKAALCAMVDRSVVSGPVILLVDRGYEACNNFAHLERKGWKETIERVFADAKEKHGMRYTLYRGLTQVSKWVRLKFATMNLKKLARWKVKRLSSLSFLLFSALMYLLCFAACQDISLAGRFSTGWNRVVN